MGETTFEIVRNYGGMDQLEKLNDRALELKALLKKEFLGRFYPKSQPVGDEMLRHILVRQLYLAWARTVVEREPKIKETVEELDYAEKQISAWRLGIIRVPLSVLLLENL
ncbi:MAG: hypothetical protein ACOX6D_00155 [Thermoguttaceae bacterium]|jgi:hypothetical protein